jgi:hypothetical protein
MYGPKRILGFLTPEQRPRWGSQVTADAAKSSKLPLTQAKLYGPTEIMYS